MRGLLDLTTLSGVAHTVGAVAIVEDDRDLQEALVRFLRALRFTTNCFSDAESFLASSGRSQIDCLILDVRLPGMSGIELQRRLAEDGEHLPVVFVTAHDESSVREQALKAGATGFLKKPVSGARLREALQTALRPGLTL